MSLHRLLLFFRIFYLFLEREVGGGERGKETSMCGCLLHTPNWSRSHTSRGRKQTLLSTLTERVTYQLGDTLRTEDKCTRKATRATKAIRYLKIKSKHRYTGTIWKKINSPGWYGSVDGVLACEPKGHWFDSQSRAHAWVAGQVPSRGHKRHPLTDVSFPLFLLPFPSL